MEHRRRVKPDVEVISEPNAERLLARASELDAARVASAKVAELRTAAAEAGISPGAFDAALGELQEAGQAQVPDMRGPHRRRAPRWALAGGVAALIAIAALTVTQTRTPAGASAPMVEESFVLRCLSPGEAAELIRPLLGDRGTVVHSPSAPRVLTVRTTPSQIQDVRSVLDQQERAGSPACATGPAPS